MHPLSGTWRVKRVIDRGQYVEKADDGRFELTIDDDGTFRGGKHYMQDSTTADLIVSVDHVPQDSIRLAHKSLARVYAGFLVIESGPVQVIVGEYMRRDATPMVGNKASILGQEEGSWIGIKP